jgi:predicted AlkP superfamily pyrophosphatase or phosphodiesterase
LGFVDELRQAGIDISQLGTWGWNKQYSSKRDDLYTRVAIHLLERRQANLVLLHLITPDGVEHAYGPHTPEAYTAVAEADGHIQRIWNVLQSPPFAGKSALFVTSDHGFAPIKRVIRPNVALKRLGLIDTDGSARPVKRQAWSVAQGGSAFVYVLDDADRAASTAKVQAALSELEGVARVIEPHDFAALGLPRPDVNPESPDLILATGEGYSFSNDVVGDEVGAGSETLKGTHGHLPHPPYMHATFVAAGTGIREGVRLKTIQNVDVAPTIARLLGVQLPRADGRVLSEILEPSHSH